ncbi:CLK4-associating serine/arginine rich protein-like, partial [Passer montanus]|uniref:CLK4-associating serine/arginine rich protein-like n=1 Tax=Passer montanus TaxID=9160 RepID=UPI00196211C3
MPWQGDTNNMIDRFDVRAHLDFIPMYTPALLSPTSPEQESDERKCNYERYRGLVQNDFAGISEEQCLYQIYIDELYGGLQKPNEDEKKKLAEKKASIGYTYEDSTVEELENSLEKRAGDEEDSEEDSNTDEDEVIPDIDVEVDVDELNQEQVADLNKQATTYGMAEGDFVRIWDLPPNPDELYGGLQKPNEDEKKKLAEKKASIGYTYEDSTVEELENSLEKRAGDEEDSEEDSNTDEDEVIPDIDVEVDVDELNQEQVADLNKQATTYGMAEGDFVRYGPEKPREEPGFYPKTTPGRAPAFPWHFGSGISSSLRIFSWKSHFSRGF